MAEVKVQVIEPGVALSFPDLGLNELIGHCCAVVFFGDVEDWPFPGYPASCEVEAVDRPMVKLNGKWINLAAIKSVRKWG